MTDAGLFGPATLAVTQGINAFATFLPKLTDIRRNNPTDDPAFAADVRMGEVAAVTTSVGIGLICSSLTRSPLPVYTSLITSIILVTLYEYTLRCDRPMEKTNRNGTLINLAEARNA